MGTPITKDNLRYENSKNRFFSIEKEDLFLKNVNGKISFYSMDANIMLSLDLTRKIKQKNKEINLD